MELPDFKLDSYWLDNSDRLYTIHSIRAYGNYPIRAQNIYSGLFYTFAYDGTQQAGKIMLIKEIIKENDPEYFL